jgi:drug/metabolite transporter (DMT)-like permease
MGTGLGFARRGKPAVQALLAAALFGAGIPFVKLLVAEIDPVPVAALLYLGSGAGGAVVLLGRRLRAGSDAHASHAALARSDLPWLAGAVLSGGVAAPIVLMAGLRSTPSATASLLLNFETVATVLLAALLFREAVGRRVWMTVALVVAAGVFLSWKPEDAWGVSTGALGIMAACALWGLDNNLTRKVSAKDPMAIVAIKGLSAGLFSLGLAFLVGAPIPTGRLVVAVMLLGFASYGLSIALFVEALRDLGAARTGALFGTAPFFGAALSFLVAPGLPGPAFLVPAALMAAGAVLLFGEAHGHEHHHHALAHDHRHAHDDGHHAHGSCEVGPGGYHAHAHRHEATDHAHPHTPDLHHRHDHADEPAGDA